MFIGNYFFRDEISFSFKRAPTRTLKGEIKMEKLIELKEWYEWLLRIDARDEQLSAVEEQIRQAEKEYYGR